MPTFDHGVTGLTGTIGTTILTTAGAVHTARTTAGITEPVAGSGVYFLAHPDPGTLLLFVFDGGEGTVGASTWDDGLTTTPARAGDAMALTSAYDAAKTAASAAAVAAIPTAPLLAVDYTAPDNASIAAIAADYAKTGEAATAVASLGYVAPDNASAQAAAASAASADGKLTAERLAKLDGAAQEATAQAIADAVAALPTAPVGTRIDQTSEDASGEVLGLATPGSSITAYLASDTERTDPKRHTTAATDGTWALYLPAGTYVLVVALDGYYDAADDDSVIERTVVVP